LCLLYALRPHEPAERQLLYNRWLKKRDPASLQSVSIAGVYPCGEGAGYAGGIAADTGVYGYTVDVLMSHEDAAQAGVVKALVKWE
jgi:hypothetical protein